MLLIFQRCNVNIGWWEVDNDDRAAIIMVEVPRTGRMADFQDNCTFIKEINYNYIQDKIKADDR